MTEIFLLGTVHLSEWDGQDGREDILSPRRQSDLQELTDRLARFDATKVGVEVRTKRQPELQERYELYLTSGDASQLGRNETTQIGFRLARHHRHPTVYAIDADWTLDWSGVQEHLEKHPEDDPGEGLSEAAEAMLRELSERAPGSSLADYLAQLNESAMVVLNDREYLDRFLVLGAGGRWGGVDLVASWYKRNLRIFANVCLVAENADRVVIVYGIGHVNSLRHLFETSGRFALIDPIDYLGTVT